MAFIAPVIAFLGSSAGAATLAGASIGLTAYGMSESSKASRKAATAERVAANDEALQLEDRAKETLATGTFVSQQIKEKAAKIMSSQRAQLAAGNADTTSGTAAEFRADSLKNASIDQLLAMAEASSDAAKDRKQARVTRETGQRMSEVRKAEGKASLISGTGRLIGQGASFANTYGEQIGQASSWLQKYGG